MKLSEKIEFLKVHFFAEWMRERSKQWYSLSCEHPIFCVCGKLATGLHEDHCRRFQKAIDKNTVKALEHLIPNKK